MAFCAFACLRCICPHILCPYKAAATPEPIATVTNETEGNEVLLFGVMLVSGFLLTLYIYLYYYCMLLVQPVQREPTAPPAENTNELPKGLVSRNMEHKWSRVGLVNVCQEGFFVCLYII